MSKKYSPNTQASWISRSISTKDREKDAKKSHRKSPAPIPILIKKEKQARASQK